MKLHRQNVHHRLLVLAVGGRLSDLLAVVVVPLPLEHVEMLDEVVEDPEGGGHGRPGEEELQEVVGFTVFPLSVTVQPDLRVGCVH